MQSLVPDERKEESDRPKIDTGNAKFFHEVERPNTEGRKKVVLRKEEDVEDA